jgi:acyl-CoA reductase-like NAD-dependent aldehyde dehydrogenase
MAYDFPMLINGKWQKTKDKLDIRSPYDNRLIGTTYLAGPDEIEQAIVSAERAFTATKDMPVYERAEKLAKIANGIRENREEFARIICAEAGKPIKITRTEVDRAVLTFTDAAEECKRIRGEQMPLDIDPGSKGRWAIVQRFPIGPVLGITPFNFPLNLVCHKVAPAFASGNPIILKPAPKAPLSALRLAQEVVKAGWPAGGLNVISIDLKYAGCLVEDTRLKMISFTGSAPVGWKLKKQAGDKRVTLELGGNAGVIIHDDADIEFAAARCVTGAYSYAGQTCISVQRIYLQEKIYNDFMDRFVKKVADLKVGDPADEDTDVGPLINPGEIERVMQWIKEAKENGAEVITGGTAKENVLHPTILTGVDPGLKVSCQEVFAPLVVVYKYKEFDDAIKRVNNSDFGLQAGVFTNDARLIFKAYRELEVGGVIAGDVPTYRIDHMPYGGVKQSGTGREGVRYAIEEMTERKILVMNLQENM